MTLAGISIGIKTQMKFCHNDYFLHIFTSVIYYYYYYYYYYLHIYENFGEKFSEVKLIPSHIVHCHCGFLLMKVNLSLNKWKGIKLHHNAPHPPTPEVKKKGLRKGVCYSCLYHRGRLSSKY